MPIHRYPYKREKNENKNKMETVMRRKKALSDSAYFSIERNTNDDDDDDDDDEPD